jgi:hypothetical protein
MSARFHGVVSIGLVGLAIIIALVSGFQVAPVLGVAYLAGCVIAPLGIVWAFCAKCARRHCCAHIIFGKLAVAFTNRQAGPYSTVEVAVVVAALLWLLGLPQAWLWRTPVWLVLFWVLNTIAVLEVPAAVCRACENVHCPMRAGS